MKGGWEDAREVYVAGYCWKKERELAILEVVEAEEEHTQVGWTRGLTDGAMGNVVGPFYLYEEGSAPMGEERGLQ